MDFSKQLEMQQAAFVRGVRAAVRYELQDLGVLVSDDQFNRKVEMALRSDGWSEEAAKQWAEMPEEDSGGPEHS